MHYYVVLSLGFFAQILFASRMIVQWVRSERAGKVISPTLFWQTSLAASFLFIVYGILRHDIVIIFGQLLSYFIYVRNLQLKGEWRIFPRAVRLLVLTIPLLAIGYFIAFEDSWVANLFAKNNFRDGWILIGGIGQLLFNTRFIYQWYISEKIRRSVFPMGFWVISIAGSVLVLLYAIDRKDPVLLVAQSLGFIIYARNIVLGKKHATE